jgi:hypothetical protein
VKGAREVVSCGACDLVLDESNQTGRAGGGSKILTLWDCPRCQAEISVITRRYSPEVIEGEPYIPYGRP